MQLPSLLASVSVSLPAAEGVTKEVTDACVFISALDDGDGECAGDPCRDSAALGEFCGDAGLGEAC